MAKQAPAWLNRFVERRVIRQRGVLEHVACRDLAAGERRLVIATTEPGNERLRRLLDDVAQLYTELCHPHIPILDHRGEVSGTEYVALRSDAVVDLETMLPIALADRRRLSPPAGAAFLYRVIDAVRKAHTTRDPRTNGPICIGAISGSSIVFSEAGHLDVIGWGYPTTEVERRAVLRDESVMFVAWEASFEMPASPNGDLDAVGRFFHALLPATVLPPEVIAALRGGQGPRRIMELVRLIASLEQSAHARDPARRSWDEYLDSLARILALLEVTADGKALERELGKLCASWRAMTSLQVAHDGSWFVPPSGTRTELDRRPSLRGVMAALVAHRRDAPGKPVSTEGLLAAGWPGDRIGDESGRNRVRVAISTVRAMGLRDVLLSRDDGYLLDPDVAISIE